MNKVFVDSDKSKYNTIKDFSRDYNGKIITPDDIRNYTNKIDSQMEFTVKFSTSTEIPVELEKTFINRFNDSLRIAMFLVGASNIEELKNSNLIIKGETKNWLEARGFDTKAYARR